MRGCLSLTSPDRSGSLVSTDDETERAADTNGFVADEQGTLTVTKTEGKFADLKRPTL